MRLQFIRQKLFLLLGSLALSLTALAQSAPVDGLTLPIAIELALKTNPLVKATVATRAIADARVTEAKASRWPALQFNQTVTRSNNPVFVFGSLLEQARFTQQNFDLGALNNPSSVNNLRSAINFRVTLFDQRQSQVRTALAQLGQKQVDTQSEQVQQQIRFEVLRAYYALLLAQAKKEVALESVKMAEADVKRSRDRVETGFAVTSDLLAAEVQLAEFRQQQIEAEGEMVTALATLNTALGLPLNTPQNISGALVEKTFALADLDDLTTVALKQRPDMARTGLAIKEREQQSYGVKNENLPRVEVFTSYGISARSLIHGSGDYAIGASVSMNLFDAGRKARLAQARAAETVAGLEQEHLTNQIRLEVTRARQQFITARERLAVTDRVIAQATEALRIVQDRYHEGLTTITEVLRAETALTRARTNILVARYEHYISYANVLFVTGQLTDVLPFVA